MSWRWRVCLSSGAVAAAFLLERVFFTHTRMDMGPPDYVDVWSFKASERLKVHEARTAADVDSCSHHAVPAPKWWPPRTTVTVTPRIVRPMRQEPLIRIA